MSEIARWTADLEGNDLTAQARAAEALASGLDHSQEALVALARRSGSDDETVANWCTAALEDGGAPADDQLDELIELASSDAATVAYWAVTLLGRAGRRAGAAATAIAARALDERSPLVQQRAAWALGRIGSDDPSVVAALRTIAAKPGAAAKTAQRALEQLVKS